MIINRVNYILKYEISASLQNNKITKLCLDYETLVPSSLYFNLNIT